MYIKLYLLFFFLVALANIRAQESNDYVNENLSQKSPPFKDRLYTGGNFGFNISNGLVYVEIAPMLGYKVTEEFSAGISAKYMYWGAVNNSVNFQSYKYYGGGIFGRYKITESILATAEYELLNVEDLNPNSGSYGERTFSNVLLLGGGYRNEIANNVHLQLFLLYDVIDDPNSPYRYNYLFGPNGIPVIYRIGFSVGF